MGAVNANHPICSNRNATWDATSARAAIAKWASSDGSGDKEKVDWGKYGSGFFWRESSDAADFGAFKLPYCDIQNGEIQAVWKGVTSSAGVVQGAMGGVHLPPKDIPGVKAVIARYYEKAAKEFNDDALKVPWARNVDKALAEFEKRYGVLGGVEKRDFSFHVERTAENGDGSSEFSVYGYASVFDKRSLDLGGFDEVISPGAFDEVIRTNPDVLLLWDHDTRYPLARTANNTMRLSTDEVGLAYYARVAPTSYANDLRVLMDRADIDQASFAFTIADQEWRIEGEPGDERITRIINRIGELFDCTICARGAYPAASSDIARSYVRSYAVESGLDLTALNQTESTEQADPVDAAEVEQDEPAGGRERAKARARARLAISRNQ